MSIQIFSEWPSVLPNDDGIRPAGAPDRCFYCGSKIGEKHGPKCCCVLKRVSFDVCIARAVIGEYTCWEPHHWSEEKGLYHKNDSSWCKDSAINDISWSDRDFAIDIIHIWQERYGCCCGLLSFAKRHVIDDSFFMEVPDEQFTS